MATPTIKTKIALDGEKEYKAALSEINSGLKVLSSEMKLAKEQFSENSDSVEALTQKNDILERSILSQQEKIEVLKAALQSSAEAYGESDARTGAWKVSLNEAEAALLKMERELQSSKKDLEAFAAASKAADRSTDDLGDSLDDSAKDLGDFGDATEDTGEKSTGLGDKIMGLADKFGLNLPDGISKAMGPLNSISTKGAAIASAFVASAKAIAEVERALMDVTLQQAEYATNLDNLSQVIGFSIIGTQQWDYILKTVGSSISEAQGDLVAFQEKIVEVSNGNEETSATFAKLGVDIYDFNGNMRSTEEIFVSVINALQNMENVTERNVIASDLLGGTGEKLIPIYNKTSYELTQLMQRKAELGFLYYDEINTLKEVSSAVLDYNESTEMAKNTIAVEFAPALTNFYEVAASGIKSFGETAKNSGLVNFFSAILECVTALIPLFEVLGSILEALSPIINALAVVLGVIADALTIIGSLIGIVVDIFTLDWDGVGNNWDNITGVFTGNSATARAWNNWNASGTDNFPGGYTWVGENGPEIAWFPRGTRISTAQESQRIGGDTFYVTISAKDVKEFNDIVRIAASQRRIDRMEDEYGDN